MTSVRVQWQKYCKKLFHHADIRVKLFNILALGGIVTCIVVFIYDFFYSSVENLIVTGFLLLLSLALLIYSQKTGKYQLCYILSIVFVFILGFPALFFVSGGYHGGMPTFFVFAILFTILMLDKEYSIIVAPLEFVIYITVCIIAYIYPETVIFFTTELNLMLDVLVALAMSSIVSGICLYVHLREYESQKEELAQQNEQLQRHNETKSTFLTTVAHEIRNPLTAISANARDSREMLEEEEHQVEFIINNLETVERIVMRIDRILIDLMDTVSIEQGRFQLHVAPIFLVDILKEATQNYASEIKTSNNRIHFEVEALPVIMADYEKLMQVMMNLLSNALKHTKNGSITLRLREDGLHQVVSVIDTGNGMAKKIQDEVFKGYVSLSKEYWRHGIGLYVCHQIITAHGGSIAFESMLGKGTTIIFRLPKSS